MHVKTIHRITCLELKVATTPSPIGGLELFKTNARFGICSLIFFQFYADAVIYWDSRCFPIPAFDPCRLKTMTCLSLNQYRWQAKMIKETMWFDPRPLLFECLTASYHCVASLKGTPARLNHLAFIEFSFFVPHCCSCLCVYVLTVLRWKWG